MKPLHDSIARLAGPISSIHPAGVDIRVDGRIDLYYRLKDARSAARADERSIVPGEPFRMSSSWSDVRLLALEALETVTSDIEILAWLAEAELRLGGFAGLRDVFQLSTRLVEDRFDDLHSIDSDGLSDKVAPFAGLNGISGEGTLIQPMRLSPLVPGAAFFDHSLWEFQMAQRPGEEARRKRLKDAATEAGSTAMRAYLATVEDCLAAFRAMTAALDERCGSDAPASSNIRSVLEEVRLAIVNLAGIETLREPLPQAADEAVAGVDPESASAAETGRRPGPIRSRDEAFDLLMEVADYFRRTEPQSPISLAVEAAVARGRMDFPQLLAELIPDEQIRRSILINAGIRPHPTGQS